MLQTNENVNDRVPPFGPPMEPPFAGEYNPPKEKPQQTIIRGLGLMDKKDIEDMLEEKIFKLSEYCKNKNYKTLVDFLKEPTLYDLINAAHDMTNESERGLL